VHTNGLTLGGTAVTSTAAELNILDGVTSTAAELNILDGVTSTTAELNILDGVTATAVEINVLDGITSSTAELNILDGVTATATEINFLDGVTSNIQTQLDAKAPVADPTFTGTTTFTTVDINGGDIDGTTIGSTTPAAGAFTTLTFGGTAVTSTATELNVLDGITATTTELNYTEGVTSNIQTQIDGKQPVDADLTAIAAISSDGILVRTGSGTASTRTLTQGSGIVVTDGDGVAGNPTVAAASLPTADWEAGVSTTLASLTPAQLSAALTAFSGAGPKNPFETLTAGTQIRSRLDAEATTGSESAVLRHSWNFMQFGTVRISYDQRAVGGTYNSGPDTFNGTGGCTVQVQRNRNGVVTTLDTESVVTPGVGSGSSVAYTTRTYDAAVVPGDVLTVQYYQSGTATGTGLAYIRNVRFQTGGENLWPGPGEVLLEGNTTS
jgi:hypothetical protein